MTSEDLERVLTWRNDAGIRAHMFSQRVIDPDEHRSWFERCLETRSRTLLIFEADGEPMGFVSFGSPDGGDIAEWGFYAAPQAPRGTGGRLGAAALRHGFDQLKLHKIFARTLASNERSVRFHQKLGFLREGILRQHHFDGERYCDVVCFGLLRTEWRP
jgi:UDP-4-amino-4,6-dideoxy-N-acetyl-beta-L-altrosamine N-acetyltransferase